MSSNLNIDNLKWSHIVQTVLKIVMFKIIKKHLNIINLRDFDAFYQNFKCI